MTVTTTAVKATYLTDAVTDTFAIPFAFLVNSQVKVYLDNIPVGYATILGAGDEDGGTLVFESGPPAAGQVLYLRRDTPLLQEIDLIDNATVLGATLEQGLDLAAMRDQEQQQGVLDLSARLDTALALKIDKPSPVAAGYLAIDADGNTVLASGTGADAALRADIGLSSGAALVGTNYGGSVQNAFDQFNVLLARWARDYVPWGGTTYYGDVWPNTVYPVAAARMSATLILVRVFRLNVIDEYVLKDPSGEGSDGGVAGGWQLVSWRGFVNNRVKLWLEQPASSGARTTTEFAVRIVDLGSYTYSASGDTVNGSYRGYGHGGLDITPANIQISLNGGGSNLQSIANWPVGTRLFGSSLTISCPFKVKFYASATQAVNLTLSSLFDANNTLTESATMQALVANVGWQDGYIPMHAVSQGVSVNRAKLAGYPAIPLVRETNPNLAQKGNWNTTTAAPVLQFYDVADTTILAVVRSVYGPPMRKNGADISPTWALNRYGRIHVSDNVDFAKFRVFINSSEEAPPRTAWAMSTLDTYATAVYRRTEYSPTGPT